MRKKIKAVFYVFTQSLTSLKYYNSLLKTDLKFSLKYYGVLAFTFAVITSLVTLIPLLPKINEGINEGIDYALELYEDDALQHIPLIF